MPETAIPDLLFLFRFLSLFPPTEENPDAVQNEQYRDRQPYGNLISGEKIYDGCVVRPEQNAADSNDSQCSRVGYDNAFSLTFINPISADNDQNHKNQRQDDRYQVGVSHDKSSVVRKGLKYEQSDEPHYQCQRESRPKAFQSILHIVLELDY
ncbi:MAG: hypothetical protein FWG31_10130 [Oscillospiraceae bacterium]|nr:hypothetical protein [Oscillospiraceae bacterium]